MKFPISRDKAIDIATLLLRLTALLMLAHGWKKLTGFSDMSAKFADPLHIGPTASLALTVFAEVFCTLFIAIGLFTRLAAIPLIINMAVIVFVVHSDAPFGKKEIAIIYLLLYLVIFVIGPGRFSLDHWVRKKV